MTSDPCGIGFKALDLTIARADGFVVVLVAVVAVGFGGEADAVGSVEVVTEVAFDEVLFGGIEFSFLFDMIVVVVVAFVLSSIASHGVTAEIY